MSAPAATLRHRSTHTVVTVGTVLLFAGVTHAQEPAPESAPAVEPASAPASQPASQPSSAPAESRPLPPNLEQRAEQTCAAFELDECVRLNEALLANVEMDSQRRAGAYLRLASAFAAMEDMSQSTRYWRLLLRMRPDMELPPDTSPKILTVFRAVQLEESRLRTALEEERRKQTVEGIQMSVKLPEQHQGGLPLRVHATLEDPYDGVKTAWLRHRTAGQSQFAALPLTRRDGALFAELPGAVTAGKKDRDVEMFVEVQDAEGKVLKTMPEPESALRIHMLAGEVPTTPFWRQPLFLRIVLGSVAVAVPAVVGLAVATLTVFITTTVVTLWLTSIQPGLEGSQYQAVP